MNVVNIFPRARPSVQPAGSPEAGSPLPRDKAFDNSLALMREGYAFVGSRCDRLGSDAFRTRIMMTPVVCMRGEEAARVFFQPGRFTRVGALPKPTVWLLQDEGSVQMMDGEAHRHRKAMFMATMTPPSIAALTASFADAWREALPAWQKSGRIELHRAVGEVLTRAVTRWAGLPIPPGEVRQRTRELMGMIEYAGGIGPGRLWAGVQRRRCERWAAQRIARVRRGEEEATTGSPLAIIATHRDASGALLDESIAAVELLNVLRPVVAVARFIVFAALALHHHPNWRAVFAGGEEGDLEPFVLEVRRYYPFFPALGGKVLQPFSWLGHSFKRGDWVLMDLYGTDHDARLWPEPQAFRPERFRNWPGNPFTLIPQGGGDFYNGHRCPGEWITIALMQEAVRLLTRAMRYEVPAQDLSISLSRMPALPASGFVIADVQPAD
jgi:fatty-acid peroxygenase